MPTNLGCNKTSTLINGMNLFILWPLKIASFLACWLAWLFGAAYDYCLSVVCQAPARVLEENSYAPLLT